MLEDPPEWLARAVAPGATTVVRLPPSDDPLPAVQAALALGRPGTVVVLVPSVGWAARLTERLRRRGVAVAHDWAEARGGWPVVVGTRSSAWAPVARLAAAVVLDAHDSAYASGWPAFDAPAVLAERASRDGATCLLVSPCPTVVQLEGRPVVAPPRDHERRGWPPLVVVDRRRDDPRTGLYAEVMVTAVRRVLDAGAQDPVVCVLHRTGRAPLLACATCGELARCERCGRAVERVDDELHCRGCGASRAVVCAACGATRLKVLRVGVSRAREEVEALFGVPVTEVSGPKARPKTRPPAGDDDRDEGTGWLDVTTPIVVGTEAVLHRLRRASAVVFLDFDQHLLAPRFGAPEEALSLLARAGRLVGGRGEPGAPGAGRGSVLVQTRLPEHPVLEAAVHGDPTILSSHERAVRAELALPPLSALAVLSGTGAAAVASVLGSVGGGVSVSDTGDGRVLVRAGDHRTLCDALASIERPAGTLRVEVDPIDV